MCGACEFDFPWTAERAIETAFYHIASDEAKSRWFALSYNRLHPDTPLPVK